MRWLVAGVCGILIAAGLVISRVSSEADLLVAGQIHVPPHLVDYISQHRTLFVVFYASSQERRPVAVAKEPFTVKVSQKSRIEGYTRSFAITLQKLEFMVSPAEVSVYEQLREQLAGDSLVSYEMKVRVDRGEMLGAAAVTSPRQSFVLGTRDLKVRLEKSHEAL